MKDLRISIYPKTELLNVWEEDRKCFAPDADQPPMCLRCGSPLNHRLVENALSRALDVYICPMCGTDEAMGDACGKPIPLCDWWAVKNNRLTTQPDNGQVILHLTCAFSHIFTGPQKKFPLSSLDHPVSEVAYSRSDYDGRQWWTTWFEDPAAGPHRELALEVDAFQNALLALPEFQHLRAMSRMCRLCAEPTAEPTEFNLYGETEHFNLWLRLITRERDYNVYVHDYLKSCHE